MTYEQMSSVVVAHLKHCWKLDKESLYDIQWEEAMLQEIMSKAASIPVPEPTIPTELKREETEKFKIASINFGKRKLEPKKLNSFSGIHVGSSQSRVDKVESHKKKTALEDIMQEEIKKKKRLER